MNQFDGPPQKPEVKKEEISRRDFVKTGAAALGVALVGGINIEGEQLKLEEYIALARELSESNKGFSFPGIDSEFYLKLKVVKEEFPEYSTPIDELIDRLTAQGMKIVLSEDPSSGNVFVMPLDSQDIEMDSLSPRHIMITEGMDERLKKLILINKDMVK